MSTQDEQEYPSFMLQPLHSILFDFLFLNILRFPFGLFVLEAYQYYVISLGSLYSTNLPTSGNHSANTKYLPGAQ